MSIAPVSPASVTGPNTNQSFFSSMLSPFTKIGTSIGTAFSQSSLAKAMGIGGTTEADFRSLNPTVKVVNSPAEAVQATKVNAANMLGINLATATEAQMIKVNAEAGRLLEVGGNSGGMLLGAVDRAGSIAALTQPSAVVPAEKKTEGSGFLNFMGGLITAAVPTLVQTGIASYQYKNDPMLRAQRSMAEQEMALQKQSLATQAEMARQQAEFQRQQLLAQTDLEKARIQAQLDATKASFAAYPSSVVPAVPQASGVSMPVDGVLGVSTTPNQSNAGLLALLGGLLSTPQQTPSVAPVGGSILTPLAAAEYQAQQAQPAQKSNLVPLLLFGGLAVGTIYFLSKGKKK